MNEYQEALNRIEEVYCNLDNSMGAMNKFKEDINLLMDLAYKADVFNEVKHPHRWLTLEEYKESRIGKECANRPLEDILYAVTSMYEDRFIYASKDLERVKNNLKEWLDLDTDESKEHWNREFKAMTMSIYEFKRKKDLYDDFLKEIEWIKNQYEVVKRR